MPAGSLLQAWRPGDAMRELAGVRVPAKDSALHDQH
jgi:hypothetical protein